MLRRFAHLRKHKEFLLHCLNWQEQCVPRPNFYFRWHLPRFIATCELVTEALAGCPESRVLDLGAYAPFAILLEAFLGGEHRVEWTRTGYQNNVEAYNSGGTRHEVPLQGCILGDGMLPFDDGHFDLVLLTEVIEHVNAHPQRLLAEISRVLAPGGRLLLSTPNASSWKKLLQLSNGVPQYDSPTFSDSWGHRYEYSYYDMTECLRKSAFSIRQSKALDVYFNDPHGLASLAELGIYVSAKLVTGQVRRAAKLLSRRGSTMFFLAAKAGEPADCELVTI